MATQGHKRILPMSGFENVGSAIERVPGYEAGIRECGLGSFIEVLYGHWNESLQDELLGKAFLHPVRPTALICSSDALALTCIRNLSELGIKVPRDMSIVGFGNLLRTDYATPALTTVTVPYEQMGREAVKMLLEEKARFRDGAEAPHTPWRRLPTQLMVRRSTAAPLY